MREPPIQVPENAVKPFIGSHNETFFVGRCAPAIQIVRPSESTAETQPKLQPALLRSSALNREL
jgi:hypothetical protein